MKSIFVVLFVLLVSVAFLPQAISADDADGITVKAYAKTARIFITPFRIYEEATGLTDWMRRVKDVKKIENRLKIDGVELAQVESQKRVIVWKSEDSPWKADDIKAVKKILLSCKCP